MVVVVSYCSGFWIMLVVVLDGGGCFVLYWFLDDASDDFGDKLGWWW